MTRIAAAADDRPFAIRTYAPEHLRAALKRMYLIRRFEEDAEDSYMRGLIHGTMHLSVGQEGSAMATCMELTDNDKITSTHRGHCIAIGVQVAGCLRNSSARKPAIASAVAARCTLAM